MALGLSISMAVCAEVSKKSFAGAVVPYQFPFLQLGLFLFVLFGMVAILCLDGSQAEKAISDRSDAGDGVIPMEGLIAFYSEFHSNR